MKLSVIIPSYNAANFIESAYQQILDQGVSDFEIIYVDNNSQDATLENIKKLAALDTRVSYYTQSIPGAAPTRNKGIEHAKGDYLYLFDVDDEIFPNALKAMIQVLDDYPEAEAVFGKMMKSKKHLKDLELPKESSSEIIFNPKPYWGLTWFSSLKTVVGPPAFLYRREVFDKIGLYNLDLKIGQDTALDIKLGMTCNIAFIDKYVYLYYKHTNSTIEQTKKAIPRAFMQWPRLVKEHLPFYLENDMPKRFEQLLFAQIYTVLAKQIYFTKGIKKRLALRESLLKEVQAIKMPFLIKSWLWVLIFFPFSYAMKFYSYYLVPYIVKQIDA